MNRFKFVLYVLTVVSLIILLAFVISSHKFDFIKTSYFHNQRLLWSGRNSLEENVRKIILNSSQLVPKPWELQFVESHQNPCWKSTTGAIQCIPRFYIGGFAKCSSTDLFLRLTRHPRILKSVKEVTFWSKKVLKHQLQDWTLKRYASLYTKASTLVDKFALDGSPDTFYLSKDFAYHHDGNGKAEIIMAPYLIIQYVPDARFIVSMRNPIDRMYSAFHHYRRHRGKQAPELSQFYFHEITRQLLNRFAACLDHKSTQACARNPTHYRETTPTISPLATPPLENTRFLSRGLYVVFIKDALKLVHRKNIFFLRHEDYLKDRSSVLRELLQFLGLEHDEAILKTMNKELFIQNNVQTEENYRRHHVITPFSDRISDTERWPMWWETRKLLQDFYRPYNQELAELLQDKRYLFEDTA